MGHILVIDDCRTVISAVRAALAPEGHDVEGVDLLVNLPSIMSDRPPDLILLDLQMPGVSGVKLGKMLQGFAKTTVPVCIYSSRPRPELAAAAREIGAVG